MAGWVERRGENSWRLNVSGGVDSEGRRIIYRKRGEASSEREARRLLNLFAAEVLRGEYVQPARLTLRQFADRWLRDHVDARLAPRTAHRYHQVLARACEAMGHYRLEQLKPLHFVEFYNGLRQEGSRKDGKVGRLSEASILYHHRVLSTMFADAVRWGVLAASPLAKIEPPRARPQQAASYDEAQVAALLAALDSEPLQYRTMVMLALATGLRRGELVGLEWGDVDFAAGTITVQRAVCYVPGRGLFTKEPKTASSRRTLSVPPSVMALLKQHRAAQLENRLQVGDLWKGSDRVFCTWDGAPIHPDTISSWWPDFLRRHGLPHIKFHALRHTSATLLIAQGVPLKSVAARLGHADIRTTANIYAAALRSADEEAAARLDRILSGQGKQARPRPS